MIRNLIFVILFFGAFQVSSQNSDWPIYRGDAQLRGVAPFHWKKQPELISEISLQERIKSSPIIAKDQIYVATEEGQLLALNFKGEKKWSFSSETGFEAAPFYHNGSIFIGNLEGIIYQLDAQDGRVIWEYETDGQITGSANLSSSKTRDYLVFGSYDFFLYAFEPGEKMPSLKYETDSYINGAPALLQNQAVFGACDGFLHMVNLQDTSQKNKIEIGTYIASSPAISKGAAYFGNYDGIFYKVDLNQQKLVWQNEEGGSYVGSPSVLEAFAVIGSQDRYVYCFNTEDGQLIWKFKTLKKVESSPIIIGQQVLIASTDGRVYLLNLKTGEKTWFYEIGSPIIATPAINEDFMVICTLNGEVLIFEVQ